MRLTLNDPHGCFDRGLLLTLMRKGVVQINSITESNYNVNVAFQCC